MAKGLALLGIFTAGKFRKHFGKIWMRIETSKVAYGIHAQQKYMRYKLSSYNDSIHPIKNAPSRKFCTGLVMYWMCYWLCWWFLNLWCIWSWMGEWWITWTGARWTVWVWQKEIIVTFLITSHKNSVDDDQLKNL